MQTPSRSQRAITCNSTQVSSESRSEIQSAAHPKSVNIWNLSNMLLNDQWVIEETRKEITNSHEMNENENITYQKAMG